MIIREMAINCGVSEATLRYYEKIGLIPPVPRNSSGLRVYNQDYVEWVKLIGELKSVGMSLDAIKEYTELARKGKRTMTQRKKILILARQLLLAKISQLQAAVAKADEQLQNYDATLLPQTEILVKRLAKNAVSTVYNYREGCGFNEQTRIS
jgi:DNA-binding transcriptional MerR regulator